MSANSADDSLLELVAKTTRDCQFDFNRAAEQVNEYLKGKSSESPHESYSVKEVRELFAASMRLSNKSKKEQSAVKSHSETDQQTCAQSIVSETASTRRDTTLKHEGSSSAVHTATEEEEDLTFAEVYRRAQLRQLENDKLKAAMFDRVLTSLKISDVNDVAKLDASLNKEHDEVLRAIAMREEQMKLDQFKETQQLAASEEQRLLNEQRESLRQRFNPWSEDAVGIDPLLDTDKPYGIDNNSAPSKGNSDDFDKDTKQLKHHGEGSEESPFVTAFNLDQLLNTVEFDSLLSEIEQDLENQAQGKDCAHAGSEESSNESSELSEVLEFLNKVAAEKPVPPANNNLPPPPPRPIHLSDDENFLSSEDIPPISVPQPQDVSKPSQKVSDKAASSIFSSNKTSTLPHTAVTRNSGGQGRGRAGKSDGHGYGYGGRGSRQREKERGRESSVNQLESDSHSESDNEDDWRTMRRKLKVHEQSLVTTMDKEKIVQRVWKGGPTTIESQIRATQESTVENDDLSFNEEEDCTFFEKTEQQQDDSNNGYHHRVEICDSSGRSSDDDDELSCNHQCIHSGQDTDIVNSSPDFTNASSLLKVSESDVIGSSLNNVSQGDRSERNIISTDVSAPSVQKKQSGILGGQGRERSRKGKPVGSRVDAARRRREQKVMEEEAAEKERVLKLRLDEEEEKNKLAALRLQVEKEAVEDKEMDVMKEESDKVEAALQITPKEAFPNPGTSTFYPFIPPSFVNSLRYAYNSLPTHESFASKEAESIADNIAVVKCEFKSASFQSNGCGCDSNSADDWIYDLLAWFIDIQVDIGANIIGTTLSNSCGDSLGISRCLYLVFEGVVPTSSQFLGDNISQILQSTKLDSITPFPSRIGVSKNLVDIVEILSSERATSVLHDLVCMPYRNDNYGGIVSGANWMHRVNPSSVATCVLKDYFFDRQSNLNFTVNLKNTFATFEKRGLRLCGLRTAYVSDCRESLTNKKRDNPGTFIHKSILNQSFTSHSREDCHLVLVACYYSPRFVTSEQMKNLLGPEDVALALRTDPASIRAQYSNTDGEGKTRSGSMKCKSDRNIAFPMAIQTSNCWKETLFWFGPRHADTSSQLLHRNSYHSALVIPSERFVLLGLAMECTDPDFASKNSREAIYEKADVVSSELSSLQRHLLQCVQSLCEESMKILTFWSAELEEYQSYGLTCSSRGKVAEDETCSPSSYFVFLFKTTGSDLNLREVGDALVAAASAKVTQTSYWQPFISIKVRQMFKKYTKPDLLQDVKLQIAHAEVARNLSIPDCVIGERIPGALSEEDFGSHEDVGLQDMVVVVIPLLNDERDSLSRTSKEQFGPPIPPQELALYLLEALPSVNHTTILGAFSSLIDINEQLNMYGDFSVPDNAINQKVYLCLRGLHIVETISDAIQVSIERISSAACSSCGLLPNIVFEARSKLLRIPKITDYKILKGKRALDIVSKCFLNIGEANDNSLTSVSDTTNFMHLFATCDRINHVPQCAHRSHVPAILQSLFPPGRFTSLSVVVIPYPRDMSKKKQPTRNSGLFIKVFKKLEKAGFDIMSLHTCVVNGDTASFCERHVRLSQAKYASAILPQHTQTKEWFDALVGQSVLCVVVAGNSALLRLQPVIGPFDTNLAENDYPMSISASLNVAPTSTANNVDEQQGIRIFHSTTVAATDRMLEMFTSYTFSSSELLLAQSQANSGVENKFVKNLLSDFGSMEHHVYQERYENAHLDSTETYSIGGNGVEHPIFEQMRNCSLKEHAAWVSRQRSGASCTVCELSKSSPASNVVSGVDVTCIVLTSALLCRVGLSSILQAVYKEGLRVVQARSELLHITVAKQLHELAGQSSLSMKPTLEKLMEGPVLFLALEGSSHVILRLRSILQQPMSSGGAGISAPHWNIYSPRSLEDAKNATNSNYPLGQLGANEWGLLASSSSRLARDLLLYCFNPLTSQLVSTALQINVVSCQRKHVPSQNNFETHSSLEVASKIATSPPSLNNMVTSPAPSLSDDVNFHTPTGSSPTASPLGLGSAFSTPNFFTPPTSKKLVGKEYEETKGPSLSSSPLNSPPVSTTALEELD